MADICEESYALYCDALLLLTALDGGEAVLDSVVKAGTGIVPFLDRVAWRARLHLPKEAWPCIEDIVRWAERPTASCKTSGKRLLGALERCMAARIVADEFGLERIDIQLDPDDQEIARAVRSVDAVNVDLPQEVTLSLSGLVKDICVRIGQVNHWATEPNTSDIVKLFPRWRSSEIREVMRQVATVFHSPSELESKRQQAGHLRSPALVVFPELAIPQSEVRTLRDLVAKSGCGSLAGLYWHVLPPVYRGSREATVKRRWVVNEAELAIPIGYDTRGPTSVRWFRVRKPMSAHVEHGIVKALAKKDNGVMWRMLDGQRWYRFVHGAWGDFSVAICADLIDGRPWRSLRGEVLHLFMVAFNRDLNLYESLTWTRTYETYANVVAVNHGEHGGSFLWSPRRSHSREIARLRGNRLFLVADVILPVKKLLEEQRTGVGKAIDRAASTARAEAPSRGKYKAPPPGYMRKALQE